MKKLTLQEMTDAQQMRVRTRIGQERKKLGRELTNAEMNKVKDAITEISLEVEKASKKALSQKKKQKLVSSDETYSWSAQNHRRGYR